MPARKDNRDLYESVSTSVVKIFALVSLVLIIWIDASVKDFDGKEVELMLAGFVVAAGAKHLYDKRKRR
jgi:hypothetical protein